MSKKTNGRMPPPPAPDSSSLIEGIKSEAEQKIKAAESQASDYAAGKLKAAADMAAAIRAEAAKAASAREAAIRAASEARLRTERQKLELESEERFARRVLDLAAKEYAACANAPDYADRVFAWLCEAAIGIGTTEATVSASAAELKHIDADVLKKVEERVRSLADRSISLSLSKGPALGHQGVLLESEGGRLAYDNGAPARLARADRAMRALIAAALEKARSSGANNKAEQS